MVIKHGYLTHKKKWYERLDQADPFATKKPKKKKPKKPKKRKKKKKGGVQR